MSRFAAIQQRRLYQDVAQQLREAILARRYRTGDRLPTETELAAEFGVSRAVVRQATMSLEHQGLVEVQVGAGGGTFVVERGLEAVLDAFENLLRRGGVTVEEYLSAKRVLEPAMTAAIVESVTRQQLDRLQENVQQSWGELRAGAGDQRMDAVSLDFHKLLAKATGNPVLEVVMLVVVATADRVPALRKPARTDWRQVLSEHDQLLAALHARDAGLFGTLMRQHMDSIEGIYGLPPHDGE